MSNNLSSGLWYASLRLSFFLGMNVDFGLKLQYANGLSSFLKCHINRITVKIIFTLEKRETFTTSYRNHFHYKKICWIIYLISFYILLNFLRLVKIRVLKFDNQITSTSIYLISHQKLSMRLKNSFSVSATTNHGVFYSIVSNSDGFSKHNLFFVDKLFGNN